MASNETIQLVLVILAAAYEHTLGDSTIITYLSALQDVPDEVLKEAAAKHISRSPFFPRISELRNLALADQYPTPLAAWGEVRRQIQRVGSRGTPEFSDQLIVQAVNQLGWSALCFGENPTADRARFVQAYEALVHRQNERSVAFPQLEVAHRRILSGGKGVEAIGSVVKVLEQEYSASRK